MANFRFKAGYVQQESETSIMPEGKEVTGGCVKHRTNLKKLLLAIDDLNTKNIINA